MRSPTLAWALPLGGTVAALLAACFTDGVSAGLSEHAVQPAERKIMGIADPYPADSALRARRAELESSQAARRAMAWSTIAKVLAPISLAETKVVGTPTIPRWQTWYAKDDIERMFAKLYADLGRDGRKARTPFDSTAIDASFPWNATMVDSLSSWPEDRYLRRVAELDASAKLNGLGGASRVAYSPGVVSNIFQSYSDILRCLPGLSTLSPTEPPPSATNFAPCLATEFPIDAVTIKAAWRRADFGMKLPTFDTSGAALGTKLAAGAWGTGDGEADPDADAIHTMKLASGSTFRLAGLHIASKELREWTWITLWWSPSPDTDFGADRPQAIVDLGPVWKNYKMCVVTAYDEKDPDPRGGNAASSSPLGGLGDALAAANLAGAQSWCSNPYLELGPSNATTNCIGCHQHAGTSLTSEGILADPTGFPASGRTKLRTNFPADYVWSFDKDPDRVAEIITARVAQYDLSEP